MHSFKDNEGRTWAFKIHVGSVKKCKAILGIDLPGLFDDGMVRLAELLGDPAKLSDVLFILCQADAEQRKLSQDDFDAAFAGDVIQAASNAFQEELVDFFQEESRRAVLRKTIQKSREVEAISIEIAGSKLDAMDTRALAIRLIGSSGDTPESSESIPANLPSES